MAVNKELKKKEPNVGIIISVLIALVLWIYVIGEVDPNVNQRFNNIPVAINNLSVLEENGLVLSEDKAYTVDISVYGRTSSLYGLRGKITAAVDISEINGKGTYNLHVNINGIPESVELKEVYPMDIAIKVDRITKQEKNVELNMEGAPESGLTIIGFTSNLNKVNVMGPEELVKNVSRVVGNVDIKGASKDVNQRVTLYAVDKEDTVIEGVTIESKTIDVTVHIGKNKDMEIQPSIIGKPAEGYFISEIIMDSNKIKVGAKGNLLDNLSAISTEDIDINNQTKTIERDVKLILPDGISIVSGKQNIHVKIVVEKLASKEFIVNSVEVANKPENLTVTFPQDSSIKVVLEGKKADLDKLSVEDIKLTIDGKGLKIGDNQISVDMEEISGVAVRSITPNQLAVGVEEP